MIRPHKAWCIDKGVIAEEYKKVKDNGDLTKVKELLDSRVDGVIDHVLIESTHTHVWKERYTYNRSHHWRECTGLSGGTCSITDKTKMKEYENHTFENNAVACSKCNFPKSLYTQG